MREPSPTKKSRDRLEQNKEIQPDAPVLDIPLVEPEALMIGDRITSVNLGPACQAGLGVQAPALFLGVVRDHFRERRAWPDYRHFAAYHVN